MLRRRRLQRSAGDRGRKRFDYSSSDLWHLTDKIQKTQSDYFNCHFHEKKELQCKTVEGCLHLQRLEHTDAPPITTSCWEMHTECKSMQRYHRATQQGLHLLPWLPLQLPSQACTCFKINTFNSAPRFLWT